MVSDFFASPPLMIMLTGALVATSGATLGTFLVLRRSAMLVDAISHSIVFGIALVWLLTFATGGPVQIVGAALTGLLTVVLTEMLAATQRVRMDAAIGLVFPALFAAGVLLLNIYAREVHLDTHTVLLGEIGFVWLDTRVVGGLEIPKSVLWLGVITIVNAGFVLAFFKELKLSTFDPALAAALGLAPGIMFYALLALTSATAVASFDAVGAVLFVAFVIVPPAAAYLLTDRLIPMLLLAIGFGLLASVSGYFAAIALDVSIGGMMALMTGACFGLAFLFGPRYGLVAQAWQRYMRRYADESRALVIHLYEHEHGPRRDEENVVTALQAHLGWPAGKAQRVLGRSLRKGLILRDGTVLHLTRRGRQVAEELLEF